MGLKVRIRVDAVLHSSSPSGALRSLGLASGDSKTGFSRTSSHGILSRTKNVARGKEC